jgi:NAD(P)-dependent dehydrogenase (short-subunit alcohol dehydrogenase family)
VIAIAGAAGGLGPVVCQRLAEAGASLACTDVAAERLEELSGELDLDAGRLSTDLVDLLDLAAARRWAGSVAERFGRIDSLLHLVGGWRGGEPLQSFDLADLDWLESLLFRTVVNSTRAFHDALAESPHGRFVLVSSSQAQTPDATNAAYAATKAAAETWTLALAASFREAESAATANIIVVNAILTPQMREQSPEKPFRSFTSAEDIAEAVAYLCSDEAAKMNGKRLSLHP